MNMATVSTKKTTKKKSLLSKINLEDYQIDPILLLERIVRVEEGKNIQKEMTLLRKDMEKKRFQMQKEYMDKRFEMVDKRFDRMDKRID